MRDHPTPPGNPQEPEPRPTRPDPRPVADLLEDFLEQLKITAAIAEEAA